MNKLTMTRGDLKTFRLKFNTDISDYTIKFILKEKTSDETKILDIEASKIDNYNASVTLLPNDTLNLVEKTYYYGVILKDFANRPQTIIKGTIELTWKP